MRTNLLLFITTILALFIFPINTALADDTYDFENGDYETYIKTLEENSDDESIAGNFIDKTATVSVQDGDINLTLGVVKPGEGEDEFGDFDFDIEWVTIEGEKHIAEEDSGEYKYYTFPLESIEEVLNAEMEYVVPGFPGLEDGHEVRFRIELDLENAERLKPDTSSLQEAFEEAKNVYETGAENYTSDSWDHFENTFNEEKENIAEILETQHATQIWVDELTQYLTEALDQLEVDKSKLEDIINEAEKELADGYTADSWKDFSTALNQANEVFNDKNATKADVDEATQALEEARANLVVDKSELKDLIEHVNAKDKSNYTTESWNELTKALEAAEKINKEDDPAVEDVRSALEDLNEAINNLEDVKDSLEITIDEAKTMKESNYTSDSWEEFLEALNYAEAVFNDEEVSEREIDQAVRNLEEAMNNLVIDKSDLEEVIQVAKDIDEAKYTKESVAKVTLALGEAERVLQDEEATVTEVDEVINNLANALENLKERSAQQDDPKDVDKTKLKEMIREVKDKRKDKYTKDSWKAFSEALDEAEKVLADDEATQEDVDQAVEILQEAEDSLKKKAEISDDKYNPDTGDRSPIALYVTLLLISVTLFTVYAFRLRTVKND